MRATKEELIDFLKEIKPALEERGIAKVALFGSYARGENGVYSDIDIAIKKRQDFLQHKHAYDYFDTLAKIRKMLQKKFHRNIDIFDLDSDSALKKSILKDLIYV